MEETEQRLAAARAKRATAQALIDAQKQLVDQADAEERALKEQLDAERTDKYEGKFVRGQSINGTVRAVKYGEAYISWADGVDSAAHARCARSPKEGLGLAAAQNRSTSLNSTREAPQRGARRPRHR